MRKIFVNGSEGLTVEMESESLSYEELKETVEKLMQPTLPKVVIPKDLFLRVYPKMITAQEVIDNYIIQTERLEAKLPIVENLENRLLVEKLKDISSRTPIKVDVDTEDLPKERYHDRTFPKNYYKKKKKKRRMQKQSRKRK